MNNNCATDNFIVQIDGKSAISPDGEKKFGDVVGIKCRRLRWQPRRKISVAYSVVEARSMPK